MDYKAHINDPVMLARGLLESLNIDTTQPIDVYDIAKSLGIRVKWGELGENILGGFIVGESSTGVIQRLVVLDPNLNTELMSKFTLAHEIGHILMGHCTRRCKIESFNMKHRGSGNEQDANIFAGELLMPTDVISELVGENAISFEIIEKLAEKRLVTVHDLTTKLIFMATYPVIVVDYSKSKARCHYCSDVCPEVEILNKRKSTLNKMQSKEKYKAISFLKGVTDDVMCLAEAKYYSDRDWYLCIITIIENEK